MTDLLEQVFEASPNAVVAVDQEGIIQYANSLATELFEYPTSELMGKSVEMLMPMDFRDVHVGQRENFFLKARRRTMGVMQDVFCVTKSGVRIPIEVKLSPIKLDDGRMLAVTTVSDTRARLRLERDTSKAMADLKRSNEELEQFAAIAAHDLQEPLRKILAFGDRIEKKYGADLDEKASDYFGRMLGAASRMQILVSDLLSLSRVVSRGREFLSVKMDDIVDSVMRDLEASFQESGAKVSVNAMGVLPADATQMRQLFQNVISNALKYRRDNIKPEISITRTTIGLAPEIGGEGSIEYAVFKIEDNGIGFEEKYAERMFEAFRRLHSRSKYEGTGIGLSICKKIVERHGGSITAHGVPDEGTIVTIMLPLVQKNLEEESSAHV